MLGLVTVLGRRNSYWWDSLDLVGVSVQIDLVFVCSFPRACVRGKKVLDERLVEAFGLVQVGLELFFVLAHLAPEDEELEEAEEELLAVGLAEGAVFFRVF